jgi:D-amino-acid oxidase
VLIDHSLKPELPWFSKNVLSFKEIPQSTIFGSAMHGYKYSSIMINVPMYLEYLYETALGLGAISIRATLPRSSTLAGTLNYASETVSPYLQKKGQPTPKIDGFVNAMGISAKSLVPDEAVYPIRGQTVTVKGEAKQITLVNASPSNPTPASPNLTYILPRPHSGTTILGGTKQANNWQAEPEEKTTEEIMEGAKQWAPELLNEKGEFEIISVQVGLRPGRAGGARVEIEELKQPAGVGEAYIVCHAYGHAGSGYQNSVGTAKKVVGLFGGYFEKAGSALNARL